MRSNNRRSLPTVEGGDPEGRQQQLVVDEIMTMLRARSEDGQILISDSGVEFFIQDAIKRILRNQDGSGHPAAPPPVEPVDVAMTGTRTGTREEFVQPAAEPFENAARELATIRKCAKVFRLEDAIESAENPSDVQRRLRAYEIAASWRIRAQKAEADLARLRAHQEPPAVDVERLIQQAHDIEEILREACIGSSSLPAGVRQLVEQRDKSDSLQMLISAVLSNVPVEKRDWQFKNIVALAEAHAVDSAIMDTLDLDVSGDGIATSIRQALKRAEEAEAELARLRAHQEPPAAQEHKLLKQIVMSWDGDESLEFLEGITLARELLGFKLADAKEEYDDLEVLRANNMRTTVRAGAATPPAEKEKR